MRYRFTDGKELEADTPEEFVKKMRSASFASSEAKALAEQGEFKKLYEKQQAELQAKEQRIKAMELETLRRNVATKLGLPELLFDRLRGETVDEIEADAKTLLAAIPKPNAPNINSTQGGLKPPVTGEQIVSSKLRTGDYVAF
jgi:formamidopyrimidine-DNA glycosylase